MKTLFAGLVVILLTGCGSESVTQGFNLSKVADSTAKITASGLVSATPLGLKENIDISLGVISTDSVDRVMKVTVQGKDKFEVVQDTSTLSGTIFKNATTPLKSTHSVDASIYNQIVKWIILEVVPD